MTCFRNAQRLEHFLGFEHFNEDRLHNFERYVFSSNKLIKLDAYFGPSKSLLAISCPQTLERSRLYLNMCILDKLAEIKDWIYLCDQSGQDEKSVACVSVISKRYAAGAAHCFPKADVGHKFRIINVKAENERENWIHVEVIYTT